MSFATSTACFSRFQFTLPRGERPPTVAGAYGGRRFQFTLPRGERLTRAALILSPDVSIHAPARGATCLAPLRCRRWGRFNSRSREGSDTALPVSIWGRRSFNSRSREGSDIGLCSSPRRPWVSIHAPARGATSTMPFPLASGEFQFTLPRGERLRLVLLQLLLVEFQFTLPRGERLYRDREVKKEVTFQFTLPRGERRTVAGCSVPSLCFNSRSREGSD